MLYFIIDILTSVMFLSDETYFAFFSFHALFDSFEKLCLYIFFMIHLLTTSSLIHFSLLSPLLSFLMRA